MWSGWREVTAVRRREQSTSITFNQSEGLGANQCHLLKSASSTSSYLLMLMHKKAPHFSILVAILFLIVFFSSLFLFHLSFAVFASHCFCFASFLWLFYISSGLVLSSQHPMRFILGSYCFGGFILLFHIGFFFTSLYFSIFLRKFCISRDTLVRLPSFTLATLFEMCRFPRSGTSFTLRRM